MKYVDLKRCIRSSDPAILARWQQICDEGERLESVWVKKLRERGVKAAHPDDGWVNRRQNSVKLVYPQFDDGVEVGDLICLGRPSASQRVVAVTRIGRGAVSPSPIYFFEAAADFKAEGLADAAQRR